MCGEKRDCGGANGEQGDKDKDTKKRRRAGRRSRKEETEKGRQLGGRRRGCVTATGAGDGER